MSQLNPFTGAVSQSPLTQRLQSEEKASQLRRAQAKSKNAASTGQFDHEVESADAIVSIHDQDDQPQNQKRRRPTRQPPKAVAPSDDESPPHLDLKA